MVRDRVMNRVWLRLSLFISFVCVLLAFEFSYVLDLMGGIDSREVFTS